jgi:hypothetical protein
MRPGGPGNHDCAVEQLSFGLSAVLAIKAFYATGGINQFLFSGEERVAV